MHGRQLIVAAALVLAGPVIVAACVALVESTDGAGGATMTPAEASLVALPPAMGAFITEPPPCEIRRAAIEGGMTTLLEDGIEKALGGHLDLRQVLTVAAR